MDSSNTLQADLRELLAALPGGVALFALDGTLAQANDSFLSVVPAAVGTEFAQLFGEPIDAFPRGGRDAVKVGPRHLNVSAKGVAGVGWLVQICDISSWVDRGAEAQAAAERDDLTGLANRAAFMPEIKRAVADPTRASALLMIDLDRFKQVNDTLGHAIGDRLLQAVAKRLSASVRPTDLIARLGGDEFAILQVGTAQPTSSEKLAQRLVELVSRPYLVDGHMVDIGASVGVALATPDVPAETLLKQADIALYRAKHGGRGQFTFFEQEMDAAMQERRRLELDLRRALAFREFELFYQPQLSLADKSINGLEALIRWHHPTRGIVSPGQFIPLAEETGLIVPIGEWVIRQACDDATRWPSDVSIAVNVSAKQLSDGKLVSTVTDALARAALPASRFEVEITESVLMADTEQCLKTLHALRDLGVRISMDDFGTGYSSLSYLRSFPFDKIKIDGSFVRSEQPDRTEGIVKAIAAIGAQLGMATIAEGVETVEQMGQVASSGCGSMQGFLISEPVPAREVPALLTRLMSSVEASGGSAARATVTEANLYRLVYYSRNVIYGVDAEVLRQVDDILSTSQRNNARVGVTGALMFNDGFFAQVLEGPREQVETVFERIQMDTRHADVQLLSFQPVGERAFGSWAMAFIGNTAAGTAKFGHYAASSGFDFEAADGETMTAHLRTLLLQEEPAPLAA